LSVSAFKCSLPILLKSSLHVRRAYGRKHIMVSVAVSKLGKIDFHRELKYTVSVTVITYSNKNFAVYQTMTSCFSRTEHHLPFTLHSETYQRCHMLEFIGPALWPPNSLDLPCLPWGLFSVENVATQQMVVYRHKSSHTG